MSRDHKYSLSASHRCVDTGRSLAVSLMLTLMAFTGPAWAQTPELVNDLAIESVTVYPGSAVVTRSGQVDLPAGTSTLIIDNLPRGLNPARLQLFIADTGVQFSNVQIQENYQGQTTNDRENELRDQLQSLRDDRQVITDRIETAQSELRLLDNLTGGSSGVRPTINGDELATLINVMSENSAQARERIRAATIDMRALDRQIEQLQFQLDQVASNQNVNSRVQINLHSDNAISTDVALTYPQGNVSWRWLYDVRLDTATRSLSLFRQAAVVQGTGEDWNNIALTLSTASPSTNPTTPELPPLFVDINRPLPAQRSAGQVEEVVVTGSRLNQSASASFTGATAIDTRYQIDYAIPGRVSLPADRQQQIFPVDRIETAVDLVSRTVPSRDTQAYLEARFDFGGESPVQNARMQLYRDGAFIGDSSVQQMLPGQSVRIPFGVDQRIEVQRFDEQQDSRNTGIFNRADLREERIRYEITSRHPQPVAIEVLDRIPVSRHNDITVDIPRQATSAAETDFGGEAGILLWRLDLAPQQTATIRHYYDIRYPRDTDIFLSP